MLMTLEAQQVLDFAEEEARRFNSDAIGTEHLLLGLTRLKAWPIVNVLSSLGVELDKVRSAVEFIVGRGARPAVGEVNLTTRAKRVLELARDEAVRLGQERVTPLTMLLGLVREGEGIAGGVLESLGVNLERLRSAVDAELTAEKKRRAVQTLTLKEANDRLQSLADGSRSALDEVEVPADSIARRVVEDVIVQWVLLCSQLLVMCGQLEPVDWADKVCERVLFTWQGCFRLLNLSPGDHTPERYWLDRLAEAIWVPFILELTGIKVENLRLVQGMWGRLIL